MMQSTKVTIGDYLPAQADAGQRDRKLKKACKEFESLLTYQLLRSMRKTVDKCDLFHGGQGEEVYQSLFDMEIAKEMSGWGPNSLAKLLYDQLKEKDGILSDPNEESLSVPVTGTLSSGYGWRHDPITGERRFHDGADIAAPSGTSIRAVLPGKVTFSGIKKGYGNVIILKHDGNVSTLYAHNSRNLAPVGALVEAGSVIAEVGSTGRSTGPHLHFEVRRDGKAVDPLALLPAFSGDMQIALKNR
jgi:murein DD-endopeptidase MepM/ murein hydrolase activator NlpD